MIAIESRKKPYTRPQLTVYGDVKAITLSANQTNADTPAGIGNTAFPVLS